MAASAGAWYRVGTVNVTNGSAAIVGVGSNWQNDVIAIAIGDAFTIDAKTWYEVIAVNGDTSITLDRDFEGSTDNGVEYAILRNTSGTILTRIAGQIAVQFNQKQLFLDELRNWLTSEDETATLTDSHGIAHVVKTVNKIQALVGTAATKDVTTSTTDTTSGRLIGVDDFGITGVSAPPYSSTLNYDSSDPYSGVHRITSASQITLPSGVPVFGELKVSRYGVSELIQTYSAITSDQILSRRIQGATIGDWVEIYHSGNTNFNEFGGLNANDTIGVAGRVTNSVAALFLPINSKVAPTSITTSGSFNLIRNGVNEGSITGLSLKSESSNKVAILEFGGVTFNQGDFIQVRTAEVTSKITVNF